MSLEKRVADLLATSTTKDLPIGQAGKRWKSGHRQSWRIIKSREKRADLKEHPIRIDKRKAQLAKTMDILKNSKQIDSFPMPRFKEKTKQLDHQAIFKRLSIHPQNVTLTEDDLTKVTPEVLPLLGQRIRNMRSTGESWANITLQIVKSYTSHLSNPSDKALKLGIVKNELRKQWDLEAEAIRLASLTEEQRRMEAEASSTIETTVPLHPDLVEDWKLDDSESPHPSAAKLLRHHLAVNSLREKL
jgi:hypothetical protein